MECLHYAIFSNFRLGKYTSPTSDHDNSVNIICYPYPSDGTWTIDIGTKAVHKDIKYQLQNMTGTIVLSSTVSVDNGQIFEIDASAVPNGIYVLHLTIGGNLVHVERLIKMD